MKARLAAPENSNFSIPSLLAAITLRRETTRQQWPAWALQ
jgi:hypothetical protein